MLYQYGQGVSSKLKGELSVSHPRSAFLHQALVTTNTLPIKDDRQMWTQELHLKPCELVGFDVTPPHEAMQFYVTTPMLPIIYSCRAYGTGSDGGFVVDENDFKSSVEGSSLPTVNSPLRLSSIATSITRST